MSLALAILLGLGTAALALIVAPRLMNDRIGRRPALEEVQGGLQAQCTRWLLGPAPVDSQIGKVVNDLEDAVGHHVGPAQRALRAVVEGRALREEISFRQAHEALLADAKSPLVRSFLRGRLGQTARAAARQRYTGPVALFWPYYALVLVPRHGRRQLHLDAIAAALTEIKP